jgi:hypothetical protein
VKKKKKKTVIAWQQLDKHVFVTTDTRSTIKAIIGNDVFYAARAEVI